MHPYWAEVSMRQERDRLAVAERYWVTHERRFDRRARRAAKSPPAGELGVMAVVRVGGKG